MTSGLENANAGFSVSKCDAQSPALLDLLRCADLEFLSRYPERGGQRRAPLGDDITFLIVKAQTMSLGCCGLQKGLSVPLDRAYELKRLFVLPRARGTGAVDALMLAIDDLALEQGCGNALLRDWPAAAGSHCSGP